MSVRSFQYMLMWLTSFQAGHTRAKMNDNDDGTLSIVGWQSDDGNRNEYPGRRNGIGGSKQAEIASGGYTRQKHLGGLNLHGNEDAGNCQR